MTIEAYTINLRYVVGVTIDMLSSQAQDMFSEMLDIHPGNILLLSPMPLMSAKRSSIRCL